LGKRGFSIGWPAARHKNTGLASTGLIYVCHGHSLRRNKREIQPFLTAHILFLENFSDISKDTTVKKGAPHSRHPCSCFFNRQTSALAWNFSRDAINIIVKRLEQLTIIQSLTSRNTDLARIIFDWTSEDLVFA
jgi:hypothetical protein